MKARLTILLFALLLFAYAIAQDTAAVKPKVNHQVAVNTTFFLKQLISLTNNNLEISPYILGYKCFPGKHHGFRTSVGGSFSNKKEFPDSTAVRITNGGSVNFRAGYEFRYPFGKRWTFFTGVDIVAGYTKDYSRVNSVTDIFTINNHTWALGGGPLVGIQVNISPRIALYTETAFYYSYKETTSKVNSVNFAELNSNKLLSSENAGSFLLPTSVFFVFSF